MELPDWSRPGEGRARTVARVLAVALPLVVVAAFGRNAVGPAPMLSLTMVIIGAAWLGGLSAGLLALAVSLGWAAWQLSRGAQIDLAALIALTAIGIFASVIFERWMRAARQRAAEHVRLAQLNDFHASAADLSSDFAWGGVLQGDRLMLDTATPGFVATVGLTIDELNHRGGFEALVDPEDAAILSAARARLAAGEAASGELRGLIAGRTVRYRFEMRPLQAPRGARTVADTDAEPGSIRAIGVMRDITEQHELVQQLSEWKERYEATVMATGLMLYDYDTATDRLIFGGDAQSVLGYWPGQLTGSMADWLRRLHPDDVQRFVAEHQAALRDQRGFRLEYRVRHCDGHCVLVEHSGRLLEVDAAEAHVVGFLRDVSEQRRTADALRDREQEQQASSARIAELNLGLERKLAELQALIRVAPIGIAVANDPSCRTLLANDALAQLLGRERDGDDPLAPLIDGAEPKIFTDGRQIDEDQLPMATAVRTGRIIAGEELQLRFAGGAVRSVLASAAPLVADDAQVRGCVGTFVDITEQRRLEQELQRRIEELGSADQRKDEFLATLAHELRNPLAPIRNASMLLGLQDGSPQGIDWVRRVIDRQTDHLARLIDDLLDVSRITRDKLTLRLERVALDRVLEAAVETVRSQIDAQRHQLTLDVERGLWLQGDQVRLAQIFTNLLSNAIKYTSPGGTIRMRAAAENGAVTISVRDNGIGIPREQLPHVFEMFYQVDRSIERSHAGLGIGLTLVERLVSLHGGEIRALSDGIGRGAEFLVQLPLADQPVRPEAPAGTVHRAVRGLRILVADDSVDSALTLTALLSAAGHDVQAVHDGFAALQRAADFRPHVLVLDIGMPGLNGYDTCRRIRTEPWGRSAVIIAVTGWGTDEDRRRSREAGFDAHLVKPVDYSELQRHFALDNISQ